MKLAEALIERADIQRKITVLRSRLQNNAQVQEGTEPNEKPADLIKELDENVKRLEYLISRINYTNATVKSDSGSTIADLIVKRDMLALKISAMNDLLRTASATVCRAMHTEIKILPAINVKSLQEKIDKLSKELRLTDTEIQSNNWLTELAE